MPPLTYTGGHLATNAYLIPNADETAYLCFDAPEGLAAEIRANGLKIEALVLTHGHRDHTWDAAEIARDHGAAVFLHADDLDLVRQDCRARDIGLISEFPVAAKSRAKWKIAGRTLELFHVPGHSPGGVAFYEPAEERLIGGDLIFADGIGRTHTPEDREALLDGIRRHLLVLPGGTAIYPGHGPATTIDAEKSQPWFELVA